MQDQKLNSHSKLNCITACIQAANAGADEALMLDPHGFVATCNSTHFFIVRRGEVWTSTGQYCLAGITRGNIIALCRENGIPVFEKDFSLYDVYGADEAFVTGTFAGLVPVREVDGRVVRHPLAAGGEWPGAGPITQRLGCALSRRWRSKETRAPMTEQRQHRHVVGAAQHLDGDDVFLRQPARLPVLGRAFLRLLAAEARQRSSDARGNHRRLGRDWR